MSQRPFDIMRWESPVPPSLETLTRMMQREDLQPSETQLEPHFQTAEMKFAQPLVRVLVSGLVQVSFPGYGVIQLEPGDILEIEPNVLHDILVSSSQPAIMLEAFRI